MFGFLHFILSNCTIFTDFFRQKLISRIFADFRVFNCMVSSIILFSNQTLYTYCSGTERGLLVLSNVVYIQIGGSPNLGGRQEGGFYNMTLTYKGRDHGSMAPSSSFVQTLYCSLCVAYSLRCCLLHRRRSAAQKIYHKPLYFCTKCQNQLNLKEEKMGFKNITQHD